MKRQSMPVRRRSVKKGAIRTLFANAANQKKKRQRAATAAEADSDLPNLGVARALMVILAIHVIAIGGIFFHSHWIDGGSTKVAGVDNPGIEKLPTAVGDEEALPKIRSGDSIYTVGTGDTYENIARRSGVTEQELRIANDNIAIRPGRYLRIPPKTIVAVESPEITSVREESASPAPAARVLAPAAPPLVPTEAALQADARAAERPEAPPRSSPPVPQAGGTSHQVKPGDTFWSISRKYGISVERVMKANGIRDPKRLKIGMNLTIPQG